MRNHQSGILLLCGLLMMPMLCFSRSTTPPLPPYISAPGEKLILVDPITHAWGAYTANGELIRWGLATAGANWCRDTKQPCRTKSGVFRIYSAGHDDCISTRFPLPNGGAPMPYCMYFNGFQALHGYPAKHVIAGNISHGCVRMHVQDAKWLRYQFIDEPNESNNYQGTLVVVRPY